MASDHISSPTQFDSALLDAQRFKLERDAALSALHDKNIELEELRIAVDHCVDYSTDACPTANCRPTDTPTQATSCNGDCTEQLIAGELKLCKQLNALQDVQDDLQSVIHQLAAAPPTDQQRQQPPQTTDAAMSARSDQQEVEEYDILSHYPLPVRDSIHEEQQQQKVPSSPPLPTSHLLVSSTSTTHVAHRYSKPHAPHTIPVSTTTDSDHQTIYEPPTKNSSNDLAAQQERVIAMLYKRLDQLSGVVEAAEEYRQRAEVVEKRCNQLQSALDRTQEDNRVLPRQLLEQQQAKEADVGDTRQEQSSLQVQALHSENDLLRQQLKDTEARYEKLLDRYASLNEQYQELLLSTPRQSKQAGSTAMDNNHYMQLEMESLNSEQSKELELKNKQVDQLLKTVQHLELELAEAHAHRYQSNNTAASDTTTTASSTRGAIELKSKADHHYRHYDITTNLYRSPTITAGTTPKHTSTNNYEAVHRRIMDLETQNIHLAEKLHEAQATAEMAKQAHRMLLKRNNQHINLHSSSNDPVTSLTSNELLHKRIKVLESQNMKLRLAAQHSSGNGLSMSTEDGLSSARSSLDIPPGWNNSGNTNQPNTSRSKSSTKQRDASTSTTAYAYTGGDHHDELNPIVAKWQADKKLQKKLEALKTKLQDKTNELATVQTELKKAITDTQTVKNDLIASQTTCKRLQAQVVSLEERTSIPSVPAEKVRAILADMSALQNKHDALERQVMLAQHQLQQQQRASPPLSTTKASAKSPYPQGGVLCDIDTNKDGSSPSTTTTPSGVKPLPAEYDPSQYSDAYSSPIHTKHNNNNTTASTSSTSTAKNKEHRIDAALHAKELTVLELQLESDQLKAQVHRLQTQLDSLFDDLTGFACNTSSTTTAGGVCIGNNDTTTSRHGNTSVRNSIDIRRRNSSRKSREMELVDTVALLKTALQRTQKGLETGVSSSKYMAAVEKIKKLKSQVADAEAQIEAAKKDVEAARDSQQRIKTLEKVVSALRGQLAVAKKKAKEQLTAREELMNAQVAELERALAERDLALVALRHSACEEARVLASEGLMPRDLVQHLLQARSRIKELESLIMPQNGQVRQSISFPR